MKKTCGISLLFCWLPVLFIISSLIPFLSVAQPEYVSLHSSLNNIHRLQPIDTNEIMSNIQAGIKLGERSPDSAIVLLTNMVDASVNCRFARGATTGILRLGMMYAVEGDYEKAIRYCYQAVELAKKTGNDLVTVMAYNCIAAIYAETGQNGRGLFYLDRSEMIAHQDNDAVLLGKVMLKKISIYIDARRYEEAGKCIDTLLIIADKYNVAQFKCLGLLYQSEICIDKGMLSSALKYALQAMDIKGDVQIYVRTGTYRTLGDIYYKLKDFEHAHDYMEKALALAIKTRSLQDLTYINEALSDLYTAVKQNGQALAYYKEYIRLKDSLENKERTNKINQLEVKYRTSEKDREIVQQQDLLRQKELTLKEKNLLLYGIISCMVVLAGVFYVLYTGYKRRQRLQETIILNMQQEQKISQLTAMIQGEERERTRIARELHDGIGGLLSAAKMNFSTLEYYRNDTIFNNGIKILDEAYDELRKTAHNLLPSAILQEGIEQALKTYCNKLNKGNIEISFQSYGAIPRFSTANELSLYRIVQELLHNVLKHANATKALVQINVQDDILHIAVEDNGTGMKHMSEHGREGMGMRSLHARVSALSGQMEIDSRLDIGTSVYLEFNTDKLSKTEAA